MKKFFIAALLAGAAAVPGGVASAGDDVHRCDFQAFAQETVTGSQDTFKGEAHGYVVSPGNAVSIRCYVTVNGAEAATTPTRTGVGAAVTAGDITYVSTDGDVVGLCTEWTGATSGTKCEGTELDPLPPNNISEAIDQIFETVNAIVDCVLDGPLPDCL